MHYEDDISIMARVVVNGFKDPQLSKTRLITNTLAIFIAMDFINGDSEVIVEKVKSEWYSLIIDLKIYITGDDTSDADLDKIETKAKKMLEEMIAPIGRIYMNAVLVDFCD